MTEDKGVPRHMPQLDSLRAFAVAGVMFLHFIGHLQILGQGVELFFVLSGFLITDILLRGAPTVEFVGSFYIRRALRLFPLYYLAIAIVVVFSQEMRDAWRFYAFYGANLWVVENQRWGVATHFWSLAVEEQFYLIWPLVVLWTPRRMLVYICGVLIVVAPLFRLSAVLVAHNTFAYVLLPGSVDALACGALLALFRPRRVTARGLIVAAASAVATILCWLLWWRLDDPSVYVITMNSLALPLFYVIIGGAAHGFRGPLGWVLSQGVLRYIGKISYGLYVIHFFVYEALAPYLSPSIRDPYAQAVVCAAVTIVLAAVSWHFFECPINRHRDLIVRGINERLSQIRFQRSD
jgi:peptidoglycan/LPS O-acetylase OafA/YrhL